jgi:nucleotide-binding universal stress UspA family protein
MHGDSMRNRIVCGIDASPASATAAQVAAQLGTRLGSEIVLVHAEPVRRGSGRTPAGIAHARERGRLHALAEAHGLGAGSRVEILDGEPEAELVRAAEAHAAEFLIVGSHASPSSEAALGRVTGAVLRRAPCPVIVVPPHAPRRRGAPGTYAVMCSLDETTRTADVVRLGTKLVSRFGGRLHAVHAADPDEPLLSRAERVRADLLVVPAHQARLAALACCPVVVLPHAARIALDSGRYELPERVA